MSENYTNPYANYSLDDDDDLLPGEAEYAQQNRVPQSTVVPQEMRRPVMPSAPVSAPQQSPTVPRVVATAPVAPVRQPAPAAVAKPVVEEKRSSTKVVEDKEWYTPQDVADEIGTTAQTIRNLIIKHEIEYLEVGKHMRLSKDDKTLLFEKMRKKYKKNDDA